jgi:hypothetical protein
MAGSQDGAASQPGASRSVMSVTGGCHCGTIRYRSEKAYLYAVHCHCSICRKSSGAAFMTWVCLPRESVRITAGQPVMRRTSAEVQRAFCASCGAQIYMDYAGSPTLDVSVGTLDAPAGVTVLDNIWVSARLPMMKGFDGELPQHAEFSRRTE